MADPNWQRGDYYGREQPSVGLAIARMIGHITYLSDESMHHKFGRRLRNREKYGYDFTTDFEVESYLQHQGDSFIQRFDANTYLYITKAIDYFDLANGHGSLGAGACETSRRASWSSPSPPTGSIPPTSPRRLARALRRNGVDVSYCEIPTSYGHDAFLLEEDGADGADQRLPGAHLRAGTGAGGGRQMSQIDRRFAPGPVAPRRDLALIASLVGGGRVGARPGLRRRHAAALLAERRGSRATGVEISEEGVYACIASGLPVHHADLDEGLGDYPDNTYDYVILSQTLQAVRKPLIVLREMLRVGRLGIVSFPNFGYWRVRWELLRTGRMPKTNYLPYEWYDTPNIHLATVRDFVDLCRTERIEITRAVYLAGGREVRHWSNLRSELALFVIRRASLGRGWPLRRRQQPLCWA